MATTATPAKKSTAKKAAAAPKPKAERKPKTQSPCQCFSTPSGNTTDEGEPIYRSCGLTTTGRFAPGHDAKLKSVLMNLAVAGQEYHRHDGGMLVSGDPAAMARDLAWSHFVDKAIERNAANNERRATRAAEQAAAKAEREAAKTKRAAEKEAARADRRLQGPGHARPGQDRPPGLRRRDRVGGRQPADGSLPDPLRQRHDRRHQAVPGGHRLNRTVRCQAPFPHGVRWSPVLVPPPGTGRGSSMLGRIC
jgi:hypothetical protein